MFVPILEVTKTAASRAAEEGVISSGKARQIHRGHGWSVVYLGAHVHHGIASKPDEELDNDDSCGRAFRHRLLDYITDVERPNASSHHRLRRSAHGVCGLDDARR